MAVDPIDLVAQNGVDWEGAETKVDLPDGSYLIGLHIRHVESYPMLGIRLDELARPISFARADAVFFVDVPVQSNPRRVVDTGED